MKRSLGSPAQHSVMVLLVLALAGLQGEYMHFKLVIFRSRRDFNLMHEE